MEIHRNEKNWYRFCRIALEWLNPRNDLEPAKWVEEVVERAHALNIDTLAFDFYHGGYAIFNGSVTPKDSHVGDADLLLLLDEEVHRRGMNLVAMNMGGHCASYYSEEHPEWRVQFASRHDGNFPAAAMVEETPYGLNGGLYPAFNMCINSPYANALLQELYALLPRYRIDGLYIEGLYSSDCFCDYCCTEFEQTFGYKIEREKSVFSLNRDYRQFRASVVTDFIRRVRQVINEVSPETVFMPCPSHFDDVYSDYRSWGQYADAITLERQWGHSRWKVPLVEIGMTTQIIKAESGRPCFGTLWLGWNVDRDYSPCPAPHYRLNFAEILLHGGTPQLHAQTIFENDTSEMGTVREMFDLMEKIRPSMLDSEPVPYAGLVLDWSDFKVSAHFKGYYQALSEKHVPFEVVSKKNLTLDFLRKYGVVILPNIESLSDGAVEHLLRYQHEGGGIVLTYLSAGRDEEGRRRSENKLLRAAGVRGPFGIVTNPAVPKPQCFDGTYYRVVVEHEIGRGTLGRLQSFRGSYAEVELAGGTCIARAMDHDYSRHHKHHPVMGWYPGRYTDPLIIAHASGSHGRLVYFTGEFDRAAFEVGFPGVVNSLAEAALWASARKPFIETDFPATVELAVHHSLSVNAFTVILVNKTTNDLGKEMVVRHVEPLRNRHLSLQCDADAASVTALGGGTVRWQVTDRLVQIELDELREYEVLVVRSK